MKHLYSYPKSKLLTIIFSFFIHFLSFGQNLDFEASKEYVKLNQKKFNLSDADIKSMVVSSAYISPTTGWYHIYYNQTFQNIEVFNSLINVTLKDGHMLHMANSFIPNLENAAIQNPQISKLKPIDALLRASKSLNLNTSNVNQIKSLTTTNNIDGKLVKQVFQDKILSNENIEVKMYWHFYENNQENKVAPKVSLVYNVKFITLDHQDAWNVMVDSESGNIIQTKNEVIKCNFGNKEDHSHLSNQNEENISKEIQTSPLINNTYTVFNYPLESPNHGSRTAVTLPYTTFVPLGTGPGSTNGWHEDGTNSFTDTRGNNVYAQEDVNADDTGGIRPNSATLEFNYPYTLGLGTALANQNASITNLFFWNNLIHDVLWKMGFDEPSGNFQQNNLSRGGFGNDFVYADAQDGSGSNNANFYTPTDGYNPRMQMFLWNYSSSYQADSDFDNAVIAHEYGHGWSIRLTGGPSNTSCLWNAEQGGEGWSDYLGLMLTTNWNSLTPTLASANIPKGIGTYVLGQPTTGSGIRPYLYSYDMANINPIVTYAGVGNSSIFSQPHGIGSIWATMLWDMTWEIILQDNQIVPNIYNTSSMVGNIAALKLVNEGLRLQPCSPSFVQARDAIFAADQALFNGKYTCAIGRAFARRGLGLNASTGTSSNDRLVIEDFTPFTASKITSETLNSVCSNDPINYTATSNTAGISFTWTRELVAGISNPASSGTSEFINEALINTTDRTISVTYIFSLSPDECGGSITIPVVFNVKPEPVAPLVATVSVCQNSILDPTKSLKMPLTGIELIKSGSLLAGGDNFYRPYNSGSLYYPSVVSAYYQIFTYIPETSGAVKFNLNASFDTFLVIYQDSFDPNNPEQNFLFANDDDAYTLNSEININLVAGQTYKLITTSYFPLTTGPFTLSTSKGGFIETYNWYNSKTSEVPIAYGTTFNPIGVAGSGIPNSNIPISKNYYVSSATATSCRVLTTFSIEEANVESTTSGLIDHSNTECPIFNKDTLRLIGFSGDILGWEKSTNNFNDIEYLITNDDKIPYEGLIETTQYRAIINKGNCNIAKSEIGRITIIKPNIEINGNVTNTNDSVRANFKINSTEKIDYASKIKYAASKSIELNTNFEANQGSVFLAQIEENPCFIPTSVILKPDSSNSKDTEISSLLTNSNFARNRYMVPYAWIQFGSQDVRRSLLEFDLSNIPSTAVIDSAFLDLYYSQNMIDENAPFTGHFGENALEILNINQAWVDSTVTWSNQPTYVEANKVSISKSTSQTQNFNHIDVTALVSGQLISNNGFMIKLKTETAYKLMALTSSEERNENIRPQLSIYYRYK